MNFDKRHLCAAYVARRMIFNFNREVMEELIYMFHRSYAMIEDGEVLDTVDVHYDYREALMNIKTLDVNAWTNRPNQSAWTNRPNQSGSR